MKPGRELDALVAEKVIKLEDVKRRFDGEFVFTEWLRDARTSEKVSDATYSLVPQYSTDIAAAMELELFMLEQGWVSRHSATNESVEWAYERWNDAKSGKEFGQALAETAPHAVCLAALKAFGVEVPK